MKLTAKVRKDGRFWVVSVPEVKGLYTQGRTLSEVPEMVRDAASLLTDRPESDFDVDVVLDDPEITVLVQHADELAAKAAELRAKSAEERRTAARKLKAKGVTVREIGSLMQISHQRAGQLLGAARLVKEVSGNAVSIGKKSVGNPAGSSKKKGSSSVI
jgi:predicted RNase H-like HicB family nuclease